MAEHIEKKAKHQLCEGMVNTSRKVKERKQVRESGMGTGEVNKKA